MAISTLTGATEVRARVRPPRMPGSLSCGPLMRVRSGTRYFGAMGKMRSGLTRRTVLGATAALLPMRALAVDEGYDTPGRRLMALEKQLGLRINIAALDTGNGNSIF